MEKHRKKLIKNATVFDGHSSGLAQGKKIVIEDDIVTEITADEVSEENFDEVFDGTGMVAMPGMTLQRSPTLISFTRRPSEA